MLTTVRRQPNQLRETASLLIRCLYFREHICALSLKSSPNIITHPALPKFYMLGFSDIGLFNACRSSKKTSNLWLCPGGPILPITFRAVWAGGPNAPVPAVGHTWTAADPALELHRQHRCFPISLREITLLTGAGIWRETNRDIYALANRLKSLLIYLTKLYLIILAIPNSTCHQNPDWPVLDSPCCC